MKPNRRRKLLFSITILVVTTLACATLSGASEDDGDYSAAELRATLTAIAEELAAIEGNPTQSEAVSPTRVPEIAGGESLPRLSSQDLPEVDFGPPGDSPSEGERPSLSGNPQTLDTEHFRIHYTTSGVDAVPTTDANGNQHPDFVEEVARAMEYAWWAEIEYLGWTAPPGDEGAGGDDRYDVYLANTLEDGTFGYTEGGYPETIIIDNPNSSATEYNASFSFMAIDNDFVEAEDLTETILTPVEYMYSTTAHEFNHALQYGYDSEEPADWLWEATATWMQDELYNDLNDGRDVITAVAKAPDTCQLAEGGQERVEDDLHWYGQWVFLRYISEQYGQDAIRALWENAIEFDGYKAFDETLASLGTDLETVFKDFSVAMLTRDFEEGADYPIVRLEGEAYADETFQPVDGVGQMGADYIEVFGDDVLTVSLDSQDLTGLLVGVQGNQVDVFDMPDGEASVDAGAYDHLYLIVLNLEQARSEHSCSFSDYEVEISSGGQAESPTQTLRMAYFQAPEVEGLLDPDEYWGEDDLGAAGWGDEGSGDDYGSAIEAPEDLIPDYLPAGYEFYEAYETDARDFGSDDEALAWVPTADWATVVDFYGPGDYDILSVVASESDYSDLNDYFYDIDFEPYPEELFTIAGETVLIEDWSEGDTYSHATFIRDGEFIIVSGSITPNEMRRVIESLLAK